LQQSPRAFSKVAVLDLFGAIDPRRRFRAKMIYRKIRARIRDTLSRNPASITTFLITRPAVDFRHFQELLD